MSYHGICHRTVVTVQIWITSNSPQAFIWTTCLTHCRIAHGRKWPEAVQKTHYSTSGPFVSLHIRCAFSSDNQPLNIKSLPGRLILAHMHLALWVCIILSLQVVPRSPFNYQLQSIYPANAKSPKLSCLSFSSGPEHHLLCALSDPCPLPSVRICVPYWQRPLGSCLLFFSGLVSLPAWLRDWQLRP